MRRLHAVCHLWNVLEKAKPWNGEVSGCQWLGVGTDGQGQPRGPLGQPTPPSAAITVATCHSPFVQTPRANPQS